MGSLVGDLEPTSRPDTVNTAINATHVLKTLGTKVGRVLQSVHTFLNVAELFLRLSVDLQS